MITRHLPSAILRPSLDHLMTGLLNNNIGQFLGTDEVRPVKPRANITRTPEKFTISLLAPGFTREQLTMGITDGTLTIAGTVPTDAPEANEAFTRREFAISGFTRKFKLPAEVDQEAIGAEFKNGLLVVTIPLTVPAKPTTQEIRIS